MHLNYPANLIQKPRNDPWLPNLSMCRVMVSSILTHAILLNLITDMCWLKATVIVLYGGTMIHDHNAALKPRVSCGSQPSGIAAGRSLISRYVVMIHYIPQLMCFLSPWNLFWNSHLCFRLIATFVRSRL